MVNAWNFECAIMQDFKKCVIKCLTKGTEVIIVRLLFSCETVDKLMQGSVILKKYWLHKTLLTIKNLRILKDVADCNHEYWKCIQKLLCLFDDNILWFVRARFYNFQAIHWVTDTEREAPRKPKEKKITTVYWNSEGILMKDFEEKNITVQISRYYYFSMTRRAVLRTPRI